MAKQTSSYETIIVVVELLLLSFSCSLLQLVLPVLGQIKMPDDATKKEKMFEFKENSQMANLFLDFLLDVLLMPYK